MMLRRDRNHPSVVMWSIGNEVGEQGRGEDGAALARALGPIVRAARGAGTITVTAAADGLKPGAVTVRVTR